MLAQLLASELEATRALGTVLIEEYHCLREHQPPEVLAAVVSAKEAATARLQADAARRLEHLGRHGFPSNAEGLAACIAAAPTEERFRLNALWHDLMDAAGTAWKQNGINGGIIAASRSATERALAILRGQDTNTCLYGADAKAHYGSGAGGAHLRTLIRA
ncbi:flagella synthesis protein FlgN [Plasticicumulans acidivorans]|uniref:Flagellar biosynthesis/type III secretory pathway chaperone n=1 Tax=Plasticicumulans acidivorans TaxID=886464 RepID=A0A317MWQ3_9GAMM|nr:flagellar protein FlgN [Plasticicumulans acidivorans]PWV63326.1 flagellar biosynthesis/type III secretory pathway chaperone [Plasticicumulans acidivorans]